MNLIRTICTLGSADPHWPALYRSAPVDGRLIMSMEVCWVKVHMEHLCSSVDVCGRAREAGVVAVAWGEVLPWFSLEFLCFWKPERGNWICVAPGLVLLENSRHTHGCAATSDGFRVALFSKLEAAKVFFTFHKEERGREEESWGKLTTAAVKPLVPAGTNAAQT